MKAVCYVEPGKITVEDRPKPGIEEATDAVVKVTTAAICGSDLHFYHGRIPGMTRGGIVGHEMIGIVEAAGKDVRYVKPGDRVVVSDFAVCGTCWYCRRRSFVNCTSARAFGYGEAFGNLPGGQAEFVRVPFADVTLGIPPASLSDEQALFAGDILVTGYACAKNANIRTGDTVVVIGCGPVGILAQMCAQLHGPARVLAVDMVESRLQLAKEIGSIPIDARDGDVGKRVKEMTGGRGADAVMEAVGNEATLASTFTMVRPKGTISVVGVFIEPAATLPVGQAFFGEFTLRFGLGDSPRDREEVFALTEAGRLNPARIISHRLKLDEAPRGYEMFDRKEAFKVILMP
jgi:2-desacetyl-2-hydroxyethyl bacteriochlorophyllide A dehydrogenase